MCLSHYDFDAKQALRETEARLAQYQPGPDLRDVFGRWIKVLRALRQLHRPLPGAAELAE